MAQAVTRRPGGPGSIPSQSMWDLWWTKWHWDRFPSLSIIPPMLQTHFDLNVTLTRRINGRSLATCKNQWSLEIGGLWIEQCTAFTVTVRTPKKLGPGSVMRNYSFMKLSHWLSIWKSQNMYTDTGATTVSHDCTIVISCNLSEWFKVSSFCCDPGSTRVPTCLLLFVVAFRKTAKSDC